MEAYEIILVVIIILFVVYIFGKEIYIKAKKLPSGECKYCHTSSKKLLKDYHKKYKKED